MANRNRFKRLAFKRLDIGTLETAHHHFRDLADEQPAGEIKDALRLAARITSVLANIVGAAYDVRVFLLSVMGGGIDGKRR